MVWDGITRPVMIDLYTEQRRHEKNVDSLTPILASRRGDPDIRSLNLSSHRYHLLKVKKIK